MAAMNPFEIFGLKPQFRIDKQKLDEKYFEIQKKVHPDRFASASDTEKRVAQQWATLINDAFQKLSDPIQRGKALARCEDTSLTKTAAVRFLKSFFLSSWNAERRSQMQRIPGIRLSWKC
ncbi:MAG: Fe-S protein assembly co-chaperone HscB [Parasutterella excrementihominis]